MTKENKKIVLAYSGGLDTSVILHWLKETYSAEVIAFTADIGQDHDSKEVNKRAKKIGASKVIIEDLREQFIADYVFPMFRANTVFEGEYLLRYFEIGLMDDRIYTWQEIQPRILSWLRGKHGF